MDNIGRYSYLDFKRQFSTRRYIYEGYGGQKHDKTLILHKSEDHPDDTIILRLCKRLSSRVSWSSCFKGKLFAAILLAILASFCYFNVFSPYLPRPCRAFSVSTTRRLKSISNETILIRSKHSYKDDFDGLLPPSLISSRYVSTFTKKVAIDMHQKGVATTIFQQYSKAILSAPNTVIRNQGLTTPPRTEERKDDQETATKITEESVMLEFKIGSVNSLKIDRAPLLSRLMDSRKSINLH